MVPWNNPEASSQSAAANVEAPAQLSFPHPESGEARWPCSLEGVHFQRMGILFTRMWRLLHHQEHKVIMLGLDNAGKTTILYQVSMNEIVQTFHSNRK
jgi:hypothetical protein